MYRKVQHDPSPDAVAFVTARIRMSFGLPVAVAQVLWCLSPHMTSSASFARQGLGHVAGQPNDSLRGGGEKL